MSGDTGWSEWQREHTGALQALQEAQRDYHRARSSRGLAGDSDDAEKEALRAVDAARIRLDNVRARQPR